MISRNQRLALRYYTPNKYFHPEKFAYHLLLLSYPFLKENDLFSLDQTCSGILLDPKVCAIFDENKQLFEPISELNDTLLTENQPKITEKHIYNNQHHESSEFNKQENNEQEIYFTAQTTETNRQPEISNEVLINLILTLNTQQGKIFNEVHDWTRTKSKL